jgi:hypothetical protein
MGGTYHKDYKSTHNRQTCTQMFIDAQFTVAKFWNQTRYHSATELILKFGIYTHGVLLFSYKNHKIIFRRKIYGTRNHHVKRNKPDSERNVTSFL